jgi:hypothetical protein
MDFLGLMRFFVISGFLMGLLYTRIGALDFLQTTTNEAASLSSYGFNPFSLPRIGIPSAI